MDYELTSKDINKLNAPGVTVSRAQAYPYQSCRQSVSSMQNGVMDRIYTGRSSGYLGG